MLPTSDHKVQGSNPARECMALHCTEPFIVTLPSSEYGSNNAEREVKRQIIIMTLVSNEVHLPC